MIICFGNTLFLGYLKIRHNHLLGLFSREGSQENTLEKTSLDLTGFTVTVWLPALPLPSSLSAASSRAHKEAVPAGAAPCAPQGLGGLVLACAVREMMLRAFTADATPYKSPS